MRLNSTKKHFSGTFSFETKFTRVLRSMLRNKVIESLLNDFRTTL